MFNLTLLDLILINVKCRLLPFFEALINPNANRIVPYPHKILFI